MNRILIATLMIALASSLALAKGQGKKADKPAPAVRGTISAVNVGAGTVTVDTGGNAVVVKIDEQTKILVGREPAKNGIADLRQGMKCAAWVDGHKPATRIMGMTGEGKGHRKGKAGDGDKPGGEQRKGKRGGGAGA